MLTTVIIPTYNRAALLPRAVNSLLRQLRDVPLDIVVADDGSTDDTPQVLTTLAAAHPQVRWFRQDNAGVASARNLGLRNLHPQAQWISFLDSDDVSPAGRFAADLPLLQADPTLDLTYGRMSLVDDIAAESLEPTPTSRRIDMTGIQLSCGLYRRTLIDKVGVFDLSLPQAEDTDYLLRIFESGARFVQTSTNCLYYFRHTGNMTLDTAAAKRCFAAALFRSIQRRKADPSRVLHKPDFFLQPPHLP